MRIPLFPLLGFISGRRRQEVPIAALTGPSRDWLVGRNRYRRRAGSETVTDGVLESSWSAKARRMMAAALPSNTDGYPTWAVLFVNELTKMAQIAFRSTNGTPAARVVGSEFGAYHYGWPTTRTDGVPTFRVMPHVYDNERGGMTLGRLASEKQRRFLCGGSRDLLGHGREIAWGGYTSAPGRWNSRFNDSASTGDEAVEVFPLGMIPPLQMPVIVNGLDLGTAEIGTWRGSDAFFYSVCFENEAGEISRYPIPQPPNSVAVGYVGFGYCQVSTATPTNYFKSLLLTNIAIGPPGTRARLVLRSTKVSVDATALSPFPSTKQLYFWIRIDNNTQTTYEAMDGSDESLDSSPVPQLLPALTWAPRGRHMGRFDGRAVIGCLRPHPLALLVAPWASGSVNAAIDDVLNYGSLASYVAVTPTQVVLKSVFSGAVETTTVDILGSTLNDVANTLNVKQTYTTLTHNAGLWCPAPGCQGAQFYGTNGVQVLAGNITDVSVGDIVSGAYVEVGTKVAKITHYAGPGTSIYFDRPLSSNAWVVYDTVHSEWVGSFGLQTMTYYRGTVDASNPAPWGVGVIPGSDGDALAENLLRTLVATTGTTDSATYVVAVTAADAPYITPGMLVYSTRYATGTEVVSVSGANVTTSAKPSASGAGHSITFCYDTGDSTYSASGAVMAMQEPPSTFNNSSGEIVVDHAAGSAAGMSDGLDSTYYKYTFTCATPDTDFTVIDELAVVQQVAAEFVISNIRMTVRVKHHKTSGNTNASITPMWGHVAPTVIDPGGTDAIQTFVFDMPTNPTTGAAWVTATANAYTWGPAIIFEAATAGPVGVVTVYEVKMQISGTMPMVGYARTYGNCWPVALPFNQTYLDRFQPSKSALMFTGASPGSAQDAINTWFVGNRRTGPANFGDLMGFADLGQMALVFFAKGRMRLWNPRTGLTHADEDYTLSAVSWTRGARSPYAIVAGNGWAITLADEGFFACDAGPGEALISKALYDSEAAIGERGELEYAIGACIAASDSGADTYAIHASVEGGVLSVRYWSSATAGYPDREVRYDFSEGVGRSGLMEVLKAPDTPFPWSAPLTLRNSCSASMSQAAGAVHHYAAVDSNAGATDGKVIEFDTGTTDDGAAVQPVGYTGVAIPGDLEEIQPTMAYVVSTKAGDGLTVSLCRDPELAPEDSQWDQLDIPTTGVDKFGRSVTWLPPEASLRRSAIAAKIWDDGSGSCPEVTMVQVDASIVKSTTGTRSRP